MLSVSSSTLARLAARSSRPVAAATTTITRGMGMRVREEIEELPPNFSMDAVKPPPHGFGEDFDEDPDPMAYNRKPVTSAHAIDLSKGGGAISALDSAAFGPKGAVVHGRFGDVDAAAAQTIPLEYLALLRPASEGAAALREISEASKSATGTVLVYGASRPAGMAAVQLANASGNAVVAVVDGQHSGHEEMVDTVKGLTSEPGTAVAEEYALCKANFRDLVETTVSGDDFTSHNFDSNKHQFLSDFKANLLDYIEAFPSDLPAAVDAEQFKFVGKEKDRANFKTNMTTYLSQFQQGADPIDPARLDANFTVDQYDLFKKKFGIQTTAVISGGDALGTNTDRFAPGEIVGNMCAVPEVASDEPKEGDYPFEFSIKNGPTPLAPTLKGGPITGAIIEVNPDLLMASEAVASAKTLRAKAEALQFLTEAQRNAFAAASSIVALAKKSGATIRTVGGSLPGLTEIQKPSDADITTALKGMEIGEDGTSSLNYFIQVYRAGDFPVYEAYAIHRANEPLSGPRQIVVTK
mmetsp:Transcript_20080/g.43570  ORF Transcript_20080/g.43570 Transcript_20080/m.43570 type:complete len:524 (+) Transcript_20080:118-1689(+)|eukprot:CAMPEP_0172298552 /NCGR_PEP_ID=MMETSP1058-20130122/1152_1 /TAXON_ID=83371 /ORGANISM="Detonula confervacea, Strain CCMP 353" /LENGTH=523 /DNA_ID=CAMNT_0013007831 /DNA_START=106 /DNA_END=1677 /DNA_ORIENTATION=+